MRNWVRKVLCVLQAAEKQGTAEEEVLQLRQQVEDLQAEIKRVRFKGNQVHFSVILKRKLRYKGQLVKPRCHSFVNQQHTRQKLVIR